MHTNLLTKTFLVAAIATLFAAPHAEAVVIDNFFNTNLSGPGWTNDPGIRAWDNFSLATATTLTAADFQSRVSVTSNTSNYLFDIRLDSGGTLGSTVYSTSLSFASVTRTALPAFGTSAFQHSFVLPSVNLAAGTYWVSLTQAGNLFGSASAAGQTALQTVTSTGAIQPITGALPFQLTGTESASSVPEGGSTIALLGLGLTMIAALRKRLAV
jgi:hypothetical protein